MTVPNPLAVTYLSTGVNTPLPTLNAFNPNALHLFDSSGNVVYEKVLETIFNQEMTNRNGAFFSPLGIDTSKEFGIATIFLTEWNNLKWITLLLNQRMEYTFQKFLLSNR